MPQNRATASPHVGVNDTAHTLFRGALTVGNTASELVLVDNLGSAAPSVLLLVIEYKKNNSKRTF